MTMADLVEMLFVEVYSLVNHLIQMLQGQLVLIGLIEKDLLDRIINEIGDDRSAGIVGDWRQVRGIQGI
jgi:hypothetical protein